MELSTAQKSALNRVGRQFTDLGGDDFATFIQEQLLDPIESGAIGITANAWDIDSLAKDGGAFSIDADNTTGLTFAYFAGRLYNGQDVVSVGAGTVALSASSTNYVECSRAGAVTKNTVSFTSGKIPLYIIVTGASAITTITNMKALLSAIPNNGITAAMLSTAAATRAVQKYVGTLSATTATIKIIAPATGPIESLVLVVDTTVTANDTDYWTFSAVNKQNSDAAVLAASDANTTKATGGTGATANTRRALTLHSTSGNLLVTQGDVILMTGTKSGSAANLVGLEVQMTVKPTA